MAGRWVDESALLPKQMWACWVGDPAPISRRLSGRVSRALIPRRVSRRAEQALIPTRGGVPPNPEPQYFHPLTPAWTAEVPPHRETARPPRTAGRTFDPTRSPITRSTTAPFDHCSIPQDTTNPPPPEPAPSVPPTLTARAPAQRHRPARRAGPARRAPRPPPSASPRPASTSTRPPIHRPSAQPTTTAPAGPRAPRCACGARRQAAVFWTIARPVSTVWRGPRLFGGP